MRRTTFLFILVLAVACERRSREGAAPVDDPLERISAKWSDTFVRASQGDAQAIADLETAFRTTTDPAEKEALAAELAEPPISHRDAREHLRALASTVIREDPPFPMKIASGNVADSLSPDFEAWCREKDIDTTVAMELLIVRQPFRMTYLQRGDEDLLLAGLRVRNWQFLQAAAERLQDLEYTTAIPEMAAAAKRAPMPYRAEVAEAIAFFDTPQAWAAVESVGLDGDVEMQIREKLARWREEQKR